MTQQRVNAKPPLENCLKFKCSQTHTGSVSCEWLLTITSGRHKPTLKATNHSELEHRNLSTDKSALPPARKQQPGEGSSGARNITVKILNCPALSKHDTCREKVDVTHRLQRTDWTQRRLQRGYFLRGGRGNHI